MTAILLARGYVTDDANRPRRPIPPSQEDQTQPPFPLEHARILYESNISNVTAGSDNLIKPNSFERYEFNGNTALSFDLAGDVDTVCFGGHNLFDANITISLDGQIVDMFTVEDNEAIMRHFSIARQASELTISITTDGNRYISYVSAGIALQMQRPFFSGHTPITDGDSDRHIANLSITNNVISQGVMLMGKTTQAQWQNLDDGWCREYFEAFQQSAKTTPFFFAWNLALYPNDVGFCRIAQDTQVSYTGPRTLRSVSLQLLAV